MMMNTLKDSDPFQEKDFRNRIHRLGERLREQSIDGALILQNTDLYYFAGTVQQSYLYIPREGEPLLMVRKDFNRAKAESAIRLIEPVESPKEIPTLLERKGYRMPRTLGFESLNVSKTLLITDAGSPDGIISRFILTEHVSRMFGDSPSLARVLVAIANL